MSTSEFPAERLAGPRLPRLRAFVSAQPIPVDVWLVGLLIVVAAVIRFATIASQSFWTDEALTAYEVQLPFGAMINTVAHVETTPPLYFLLIWGWGKVLGTSEVALRSISALAGVALVPIAYLSARELVSRWAGVIAAAFVAVNPFLIWYSQEARAYMLVCALAGASLLWFARARNNPSRRNLVWWAIFSALALMTHFFAGFVVFPEAAWLLWIHRTRAVAVAVAAVGAAQAAMLPFAFIDTHHGVEWIALTPRYYRLGQVPLEFSVNTLYRSATPTEGLIGGGVLLAIVVLLLALAGDRRSRRGAVAAGVIAGAGIVIPLAFGFVGQDYFLARNLIPVWLPLAIAVAAACAVPRARVLGGLLAVALLAMFVASTIKIQNDAFLQRPAWRELAQAIGPATVPRAVLAGGGTSSDPLKIYLPEVSWAQPPTRRFLISQVVVVGTRRKLSLIVDGPQSKAVEDGHKSRRMVGIALPRSVSVRGARLLSRVSVDQWVVAKFALRHPMWVSVERLTALAPRFFRRAPSALLVFQQPPDTPH
jgi:uncharacterized membrane protein